MESEGQRLKILIVGATGNLGSAITRHCLSNPNLLVSVLVRNLESCKELLSSVEKSGGRVIRGDITNPESIKGVTKGFHTVISAVSSYEESVMVDGQINLIKEAVSQGVTRFVPSHFGLNYDNFTRDELSRCPIIHYKLKILEYLESSPIQTLWFSPGSFIETFFRMQTEGLTYWGSGTRKFDLTSFDDMARFVCSAVSSESKTGHLVFVGESLTMQEISTIYNKVRNTQITPKKLGSLEDLRDLYEEKRKKGDYSNANMLALQLILYDERSRFTKTNNKEFTQVKPTSLEDLWRKTPSWKLPSTSEGINV